MVAVRSSSAPSPSSPSVPLSKRGLPFNISASIRIGHEVTLCKRRSPRLELNNDKQWRYLKCIFTCPSLSSPTPAGTCSSSSPSSSCDWQQQQQQQQRQQLHIVLQRVSLHASEQLRRYTTVLSILLWFATDTTSFVKDKRQLCFFLFFLFDKLRVRVCFASFSM